MSQLRDNLEYNTNLTRTENGDLAFRTTFSDNLDFFALASSLRVNGYLAYSDLRKLLNKATLENLPLAIKNIFFLRDVRQGNKERALGRYSLTYLSNEYEDEFIKIIPYIAEIGRFDDLTYIMYVTKSDKSRKEIAQYIYDLMNKDYKSDEVSLLAKWLPTTDAGKRTNSIAKVLIKELNKIDSKINKQSYTRIVKNLRKRLNLLETKIVEENFEAIDYSKVPGQAMLKNRTLFERKDEARYLKYLESLEKGEVKSKTQTVTPVQLVSKLFRNFNGWDSNWKTGLSENEIKSINFSWRDLDRNLTDKNILVVRDGSGSMLGTPLETSTALAIYASECLTGAFENSFITFSEDPEFVQIPEYAQTLSDKVKYVSQFNDYTNTNIEAVYDLILESSIGVPEEEQLDTVVIVSDMQFDYIDSDDESTYMNAKREFSEQGVKFPHIVFWNVRASGIQYPATNNDNVSLISGYSHELFKEIIKNEVKTPVERMLSTLSRYDYLDEVL